MKTSDALADADAAYGQGDYAGSIRALFQLLSADLAHFEDEAARYVAAFPESDRSRFWSAPKDFYPDSAKLESIFDFIYARQVWGGGSGAGSDLKYTVLYIAYVQALMDSYEVRSVLDLGCGDWRFSHYLDFSDRTYLGLDIVPSVIAANRIAFATSNIRFEQADVSAHAHFGDYDLILCKDVLQHLTNAHVSEILAGFGSARLALITNDYHPSNIDCHDGETRPLDVTMPPFGVAARPVLQFGGKIAFLAAP